MFSVKEVYCGFEFEEVTSQGNEKFRVIAVAHRTIPLPLKPVHGETIGFGTTSDLEWHYAFEKV